MSSRSAFTCKNISPSFQPQPQSEIRFPALLPMGVKNPKLPSSHKKKKKHVPLPGHFFYQTSSTTKYYSSLRTPGRGVHPLVRGLFLKAPRFQHGAVSSLRQQKSEDRGQKRDEGEDSRRRPCSHLALTREEFVSNCK